MWKKIMNPGPGCAATPQHTPPPQSATISPPHYGQEAPAIHQADQICIRSFIIDALERDEGGDGLALNSDRCYIPTLGGGI